MSSLKQRLRRPIDAVGLRIASAQVRRFRRANPGAIVVLDIDNTLADAWPTFAQGHPNERARMRAMVSLPGMKAAAYDGDRPVLFLSYRDWWHWPLTRAWLRAQGMTGTLVLVSSPAQKLRHLRHLASGPGPVVYWDDLSHGTEQGATELYQDVIDAVRALALEYHGYDEIEAVIAAAGGRQTT